MHTEPTLIRVCFCARRALGAMRVRENWFFGLTKRWHEATGGRPGVSTGDISGQAPLTRIDTDQHECRGRGGSPLPLYRGKKPSCRTVAHFYKGFLRSKPYCDPYCPYCSLIFTCPSPEKVDTGSWVCD